ncbi:MAG TPA: hypothetical protein VLF59_03930 [Candidatus Saccharimonadales bacterium]|nr:hypothetical protein [Candidatus Saccharimonadales bacterium]
MKNPGQNERRAKAPQERMSAHVARLVEGYMSTALFSLHAAYPHEMRAFEEIRTGKRVIDPSTNLQEAAHDFFQPKTYGAVANQLVTASHTIARPQFEAAPVVRKAVPRPAAPATQPTPELTSDPFAHVPGIETPMDYPTVASMGDTPGQAAYLEQFDAALDAGTAGGRAHMDAIDLYQAEGAGAGYLDGGADAARQMVQDAYDHGERNALEQVG